MSHIWAFEPLCHLFPPGAGRIVGAKPAASHLGNLGSANIPVFAEKKNDLIFLSVTSLGRFNICILNKVVELNIKHQQLGNIKPWWRLIVLLFDIFSPDTCLISFNKVWLKSQRKLLGKMALILMIFTDLFNYDFYWPIEK